MDQYGYRLWSAVVTTLLLVVSSRLATADDVHSCSSTVGGVVAPCLSFLKGEEDPSDACWAGVKNLHNITEIRADRVAASKSGKENLVKLEVSDPKSLPLLSEKCGVDYNLVPVDQNTYYNRIFAPSAVSAPCLCMCLCIMTPT